MRIKTAELTGDALNIAVATADGTYPHFAPVNYCAKWEHGGPVIERERIAVWPDQEGGYLASANEGQSTDYRGDTYLIAAMRCYVASRLGEEVDVGSI
jgi:hypothetical protein